jgi:hypothetical protein
MLRVVAVLLALAPSGGALPTSAMATEPHDTGAKRAPAPAALGLRPCLGWIGDLTCSARDGIGLAGIIHDRLHGICLGLECRGESQQAVAKCPPGTAAVLAALAATLQKIEQILKGPVQDLDGRLAALQLGLVEEPDHIVDGGDHGDVDWISCDLSARGRRRRQDKDAGEQARRPETPWAGCWGCHGFSCWFVS